MFCCVSVFDSWMKLFDSFSCGSLFRFSLLFAMRCISGLCVVVVRCCDVVFCCVVV